MISLLGAARLRPCRVRMGHADCQHANQTAGQFPTGHLKSISHFMQDQQWGWDLPFKAQIAKSPATGDGTLFWEAHRVGQRRPYWHMEQLTNLGALPPHGFDVAVFPLKIVGASAAPARVVALVR